MFDVEKIEFASSNGIDKIQAKIIKPINTEIIGILQICHGMGEYFDKYQNFINYAAENGFIVCGHDQLGHGDSASSEENKGFFAKREGYKFLIEDVKKFNDIIRERYVDIPLYLFGHSMGSLISRCYSAKYGDVLSGLIICGTIGPQPLAKAGIKIAKIMENTKGDHYRSKKLYNLALDFASIKFLPIQSRYDWVSSDEEEVKRRVADERSNFILTVSAFADVFHLVNLCNSEMVIKTIPKDLPILFISGGDDPLGEQGVGVLKAAKLYKEIGIKDVTCKLYPSDRHEIMNEKNKEEVYEDILSWIGGKKLQNCEEI